MKQIRNGKRWRQLLLGLRLGAIYRSKHLDMIDPIVDQQQLDSIALTAERMDDDIVHALLFADYKNGNF